MFQTNFIDLSEAHYQYREPIFFYEVFQKKTDKLGHELHIE
jgi:hypothetical protein